MDITALSQLAGAVPVTPPVTTTPLSPDDLVVERFNEVMNAPAVGAELAIQNGAIVTDGKPAALGDAILRGLTAMTGDLTRSWGQVRTIGAVPAAVPEITPTFMLQAQVKVMEFTVLYDIVGKGLSKSVQNLDQLVKMQ